MFKYIPALFSLCLLPAMVAAGTVNGNWSTIPIFNQAPLELKLGAYAEAPNADLLVMVLWDGGTINRLDAVRIPAAYDGTGVTSVSLDSGSTLFALGDICTLGNTVVVPYIKDFDIRVARFDGANWSTTTITATQTNNYTTADCGASRDGLFISGMDFDDSEIEIFRGSAGISKTGGSTYTFYGRYGTGNVRGPFSGAPREQLITSLHGSRAVSIHQLSSGRVRATDFDTSQSPPNFRHTTVADLAAPPGSFVVVRESTGTRCFSSFYASYNADGNARTIIIPVDNPPALSTGNLGSVSNTGSQYGFQGGGIVCVGGADPNTNVLWGDFFLIDSMGSTVTDASFPNAGVGGPIDGCTLSNGPDVLRSIYAAPRVGSDGTDLLLREEGTIAAFADGFEDDEFLFSCD